MTEKIYYRAFIHNSTGEPVVRAATIIGAQDKETVQVRISLMQGAWVLDAKPGETIGSSDVGFHGYTITCRTSELYDTADEAKRSLKGEYIAMLRGACARVAFIHNHLENL